MHELMASLLESRLGDVVVELIDPMKLRVLAVGGSGRLVLRALDVPSSLDAMRAAVARLDAELASL